MAYGLRNDIHFCIVGERAIFLDVRHNRYFALTSRLDCIFRSFAIEDANSLVNRDSLDELSRAGVLTAQKPDSEFGRGKSRFPSAGIDLSPHESDRRPAMSLTVYAVLAQLSARIVLKLVPFHRIVTYLQNPLRRSTDKGDCVTGAKQIAIAFERAALFVKSQGNCLPRSLAFLWLCRCKGFQPNLVIGVRMHPFAAHAWIQDGDVILNDLIEETRIYEPILVI